MLPSDYGALSTPRGNVVIGPLLLTQRELPNETAGIETGIGAMHPVPF